jgi:hypothetical protein
MLAPLPVIGSTPDDTCSQLSTPCPVRYRRGRRWAHANAPQTASESRWRVSARIGPPPASCHSGESCAGFWAKGALGATSPRAVTSTQPSSCHRARFTHSRAPGCRSATVVLNILNGPRGARAEFLAPHVTHGRKRPQSVAGASPVRQFDSLGARSGTSPGHNPGSPGGTRWRSRAATWFSPMTPKRAAEV